MKIECLNEIDQQAESSLLRLQQLWQSTHSLPTSQQQPFTEALEDHYLTLQELQAVVEELRSQNENLAAIHQVLEVERQRYQELFELAPDGYLVTDTEAIILEANQAAGELLNCSPKRLIGKPLILFVDGESRRNFHTTLSQIQSSKKTTGWEVQIQPRNLAPFAGLFKVVVVRNSEAQVIGLRWSLQDITQRQQYEATVEIARSSLEKQMEERTVELSKTNQQLKQEIAQRQQVEAVLRQQTEWARLMMGIQAQIRQSLNLEEILNTTVAEVRQFLGADRVVVYQAESTGAASVVSESVDAACTSLLGIKIDTPLFRERVALYRQGNTRVIHDIQDIESPTALNQFLQQQQVKASLTVPILHGNQFWGLLAIHQCGRSRQWQQLEVELLQQLATQVSIAIGQSQLYSQVVQLNTNLETQVQQRTAQLQKSLDFEAMLKRISDDVRDTLDEGQILQIAVWELAIVLNIHGCNTGLYDAELTTSSISYEYTVGMDSLQGQIVQMQNFPEVYRQLLQGQYFQFCELVPNWQAPVTILACPIFDDRGVIGDLWLFKQPEAAFNELEIRLVQQVANQCAIAIRQARLYQAAQVKIQELETINRFKDDFLHTISDELRTPLANMKMAIQMLGTILHRRELSTQIAQAAPEQNKVERYFQILSTECERELNLIDDLLDLHNLSDHPQRSVLTSIRLQDWLPQIVEPFKQRSRNYQQSLSIDIPPDLPRLICEPNSLGRILTELLNNACKFTPSGEKIVVQAQTVEMLNPTSIPKIQISVSNWGVEIPASKLTRIFEKFYRISSHDFWNQGGTGLGLALVQQLVVHLGGKVSVESSAHQTCFTVELPLN